jgi:hypothetical protein
LALDAQEAIDLAPRAFGQSDLFARREAFKLELETPEHLLRLAKAAAPSARMRFLGSERGWP